jgi:RNA polymerase sigma factor (sigma-70 family)
MVMATLTTASGVSLRGGAVPHVVGERDAGERDAQVAVRAIYDAHYARLAGWTAKLVGDAELAHDLATEAFVRLLQHFDTVEEPRAWLYTATANLARDHWRKRGRERTAYQRVGLVGELSSGVGDAAMTLTLRDVVLGLPDRLRMAVILHYYADLSVAQVASRLGKSEGAVKRDLFDARRRLAPRLEGVR